MALLVERLEFGIALVQPPCFIVKRSGKKTTLQGKPDTGLVSHDPWSVTKADNPVWAR